MRAICILLSSAIVVAGVSVPKEAKAWGEFGHLTVCDLAYRNFTPATRRAVKELFAGGVTITRNGDTRTYTSLNVGCLEEDERPRIHPTEHFINVDRSLPAITDDICPLSESTGQPLKCILSGIRRDRAVLADISKPRMERVIALLSLGHWIGDIHQPLHISYADDTGGNGIKVSFSGKCGLSKTGNPYRPKNLHAVWDNCLLENGIFQRVRERDDYKPGWSRRTITYRAVDTLDANTTLSEKLQFVSTAPWQWAAESYVLAREPSVEYCVLTGSICRYSADHAVHPDDGDLEKKVRVEATYLNMFKNTAGERVRRAGIRLAHLVNDALDPAYVVPTD